MTKNNFLRMGNETMDEQISNYYNIIICVFSAVFLLLFLVGGETKKMNAVRFIYSAIAFFLGGAVVYGLGSVSGEFLDVALGLTQSKDHNLLGDSVVSAISSSKEYLFGTLNNFLIYSVIGALLVCFFAIIIRNKKLTKTRVVLMILLAVTPFIVAASISSTGLDEIFADISSLMTQTAEATLLMMFLPITALRSSMKIDMAHENNRTKSIDENNSPV